MAVSIIIWRWVGELRKKEMDKDGAEVMVR